MEVGFVHNEIPDGSPISVQRCLHVQKNKYVNKQIIQRLLQDSKTYVLRICIEWSKLE